MVAHFHSTSGIAYPKDMELLKDVFDRVCLKHGLPQGSSDAEEVARAAMSLFTVGVVDEDDLVASLEEFLRRRSSNPGRIVRPVKDQLASPSADLGADLLK